MRLLFIGDIVGTPGVNMVRRAVPVLRQRERLDLVIANAENATSGSGLTERHYKRLRAAGVDLMTLGDHIYKKAEIIPTLEREERVCKPANFPTQAPGREYALATTEGGVTVAVLTVLGRTFMRPVDCPYRACDRVLEALQGKASVIVVDAHAEATADKYLLAHYLKGRVSAVLGTHTHVQTADEQVLPPGTAFVCDVGMTGCMMLQLSAASTGCCRRRSRSSRRRSTWPRATCGWAGRLWTWTRRPGGPRASSASCCARPTSRRCRRSLTSLQGASRFQPR
ncbi:MAG: TIGR00282 family metallophosphoesterase [Gemmataceae bacterium]